MKETKGCVSVILIRTGVGDGERFRQIEQHVQIRYKALILRDLEAVHFG